MNRKDYRQLEKRWSSRGLAAILLLITGFGLLTACTLDGSGLSGAAGAQETLIAEGLSATPFLTAQPETTRQAPSATPAPPQTPTPPPDISTALRTVDRQLQNNLQANLAFNKPESMVKGSTVIIELLLNPLASEADLATEVVSRGNFATSTAEPGQLVSPGGSELEIATGQVEITDRMKAVLASQDPDAFEIRAQHDAPEQVISTLDTTKWRWSVTSKKEGSQALKLVLYRLIKYEGQDYWREVKTYDAQIVVEVTPLQRVETILDWKIISLVLLPLLVAGFWRLIDSWSNPSTAKPKIPEPPRPKKRQRN